MDLRRGPSAVEFGVVPQYLHIRRGTEGRSHSCRDIRAVLLSRADLPDPPAPYSTKGWVGCGVLFAVLYDLVKRKYKWSNSTITKSIAM